MSERSNVITFKGNPMTLVGPELKTGEAAPAFTAVSNALQPVGLADFKGQVVLISSVPSLDTPVCELQTKRFNEEAAKLDAKIVTISMDLPFAQKRFCASNQAENITVLSDYKDRDFAHNYGLYIKELGLIARAVLVIDKAGKLDYVEIVKEVTDHPNYEAALAHARALA